MSKISESLPYDLNSIAAQCDPLTLRLGTAGVSRNGNHELCGRPVVAIRRWMRSDGPDCEDMPETGWYGPVCKTHASRDMVPLSVVLDVMMGAGR